MVHSITAFHLFVVLAAVPCASLKLAVAGATGRTGRLVVERAVAAGHEVTALVRNVTKAKEVLPPAMAMREIDLATATGADMREACEGSERLLWCASGFTEDMQSIDLRGMKELVPGAIDSTASTSAPIVVMLSSAGVSRPSWDDAKKERLVGASDIPIIRYANDDRTLTFSSSCASSIDQRMITVSITQLIRSLVRSASTREASSIKRPRPSRCCVTRGCRIASSVPLASSLRGGPRAAPSSPKV